MERKIGEIFKYNDEWYQCVGGTCRNCSFYYDTVCKNITTIGSTNFGNCHCSLRTDHKSVIFKKLEKLGEPYKLGEVLIQQYQGLAPVVLPKNSECSNIFRVISSINVIEIEIKQNKEDMEEKTNKASKKIELNDLVNEYINELIDYDEFEKGIIEWSVKYSNLENIGKNLKPFDLNSAKAGKPVCTRDGRKARIICFDRRLFYKNVSYPILALVECSDGEDDVCGYNEKGKVLIEDGAKYKDDLMMLPEKKEGWVVIRRSDIYENEGQAKEAMLNSHIAVMIKKITWEE